MAGSNVQVYMEKHKINQLFEDLMSRVASEQPEDPVSFLITALRAKQTKKKTSTKTSLQQAPSSPSLSKGRGTLHIKGSTVAPKQANSKLTKSSDSIRPSSASHRHVPLTSSSTSKLRPTTAQGVDSRSKSPSRGKVSKSVTQTGPPKSVTQTGPSKSVTQTGPSKSVTQTGPSKHHVAPKGKTVKEVPSKKTVSSKKPKESKEMEKPSSLTRKCSVLLSESEDGHLHTPNQHLVDELFGEKDHSQVNVSEEEEEPSNEGNPVIIADTLEDEAMKALRKHQTVKLGHCKHGLMMEHVSNIDSSGYVSSSDDSESSDDNKQELYESPSLLQDEGVMVESRQPTRYRKASSKTPDRDPLIKFTICTQCSRILPSDTGTSSSDQKSTHHGMEDIESVSQVGSHVSFPQWDSMQEGNRKLSVLDLWTGPPSANVETSSVVTATSLDTWAGLAPPRKSPYLSSDAESETTVKPGPWTQRAKDNNLVKQWTNQP